MSYGIICRSKGCREYACCEVELGEGRSTYLCSQHLHDMRRAVGGEVKARYLEDADHKGDIGMQSISKQKGADEA